MRATLLMLGAALLLAGCAGPGFEDPDMTEPRDPGLATGPERPPGDEEGTPTLDEDEPEAPEVLNRPAGDPLADG